MILLAVCSAFLPYYIATAAIAVIALYILISKKRISGCTKGISNALLYSFSLISLLTAFVYDNLFGMAVSLAFFGLILIINFSANVCTPKFFEKVLFAVTVMSVVLSIATFIEKIFYLNQSVNHRCAAWCLNPNYLADILVFSIITCAYLEITKKCDVFYCYVVAGTNILALYFTGSMSSWVALFTGISVLLFIMKHHISLGILFMAATFGILMLIVVPELFPRLNQTGHTTLYRIEIWEGVIEEIKKLPLFGRGFFACKHLNMFHGGSMVTWHSHNIILEVLLCFGIVGTAVGGSGFYILLRRITHRHEKTSTHGDFSDYLIALLVANLVHSMVDLTLFWSQTALITAIVLGGVLGCTVKRENELDGKNNTVLGG